MRTRSLLPCILAATGGIAAILFLPVVAVEAEGEGWWRIALPGTAVVLSHRHSVERTLVEDRFEVGWRGGLVHRGSATRSYGAGLPAMARPDGGALSVAGTGQRHHSIPLRFGPGNEPMLRVGRAELSLAGAAASGRVTLRVHRLWEAIGRPPYFAFVASLR